METHLPSLFPKKRILKEKYRINLKKTSKQSYQTKINREKRKQPIAGKLQIKDRMHHFHKVEVKIMVVWWPFWVCILFSLEMVVLCFIRTWQVKHILESELV